MLTEGEPFDQAIGFLVKAFRRARRNTPEQHFCAGRLLCKSRILFRCQTRSDGQRRKRSSSTAKTPLPNLQPRGGFGRPLAPVGGRLRPGPGEAGRAACVKNPASRLVAVWQYRLRSRTHELIHYSCSQRTGTAAPRHSEPYCATGTTGTTYPRVSSRTRNGARKK